MSLQTSMIPANIACRGPWIEDCCDCRSLSSTGGVSTQSDPDLYEPGTVRQSSRAMLPVAAEALHAPSDTDSSGTDGIEAAALAKGSGPRIYIGGVSTAISQTMIRNHFNQFGKVVDVYFPRHHPSGQRQPYCFVTFLTRKAANTAVSKSKRMIHGHQVGSIAHTTDRVTHYRPSAPGQECQTDPGPNTAAAHYVATNIQRNIDLANLFRSQAALGMSSRAMALEDMPLLLPERPVLPQTTMSTPTPAEILAAAVAQAGPYRPANLYQHSEYISSMMAAYLQANAPTPSYAVLPSQQMYNSHGEEAMQTLWRLQNPDACGGF